MPASEGLCSAFSDPQREPASAEGAVQCVAESWGVAGGGVCSAGQGNEVAAAGGGTQGVHSANGGGLHPPDPDLLPNTACLAQ